MLGRAAVADHQARPPVAARRAFAGAIAFQPVHGDAVLAGTGDDGTLGLRSGEFEHRKRGTTKTLPLFSGGKVFVIMRTGMVTVFEDLYGNRRDLIKPS